jgi:hypothetical protein
MNQPTNRKQSGPRLLALIGTAVLLNAGSAFAAVHADDAQAQARALLSGRPTFRSDGGFRLPAAGGAAYPADPQDQARALLAGTPAFPATEPRARPFDSGSGAASPTAVAVKGNGHGGAEESARRMILGRGA